jgi:16S rRNA (uracil1498-N3)-methyltransferase
MIKRRAPIAKLAPGELTLDAATSRYLARVLRLDVGSELVAFDSVRALEADAKIVALDRGMVTLHVSALRNAAVVATRSVTLVQGMAKGEKCDAIVRDATELGITKIIFADTERSVVKLTAARASERLERWKKIADEAARQCGRGDAPRVAIASWNESVEAAASSDARFVLDPYAHLPLTPHLFEAARDRDHGVVFAVGAEGGLTREEVETAENKGFRAVSFGTTILRTETMAAALLGALRACIEASDAPVD